MSLNQLRNLLKGKKTYLGMVAAGLLGVLWSSGLISDDTAKIAATIIATWTGISLRAAIGK